MKLSPYDLAWEIQDWSWRRATKLGAGTVAEAAKKFKVTPDEVVSAVGFQGEGSPFFYIKGDKSQTDYSKM